MSDTLRLFVAVPLPAPLTAYFLEARLAYDHAGVRPVPQQNLHLTLFFLGNVPAAEVPAIWQNLTQVARQHDPFTLTFAQLEPGPNSVSPRLIWGRFEPHASFTHLSRALTQTLAKTPPKHEKFIPHVTLCRFVKDARVPKPMPVLSPSHPIHLPVNSFALWHSQLASPHPVYAVMETFDLGNQ